MQSLIGTRGEKKYPLVRWAKICGLLSNFGAQLQSCQVSVNFPTLLQYFKCCCKEFCEDLWKPTLRDYWTSLWHVRKFLKPPMTPGEAEKRWRAAPTAHWRHGFDGSQRALIISSPSQDPWIIQWSSEGPRSLASLWTSPSQPSFPSEEAHLGDVHKLGAMVFWEIQSRCQNHCRFWDCLTKQFEKTLSSGCFFCFEVMLQCLANYWITQPGLHETLKSSSGSWRSYIFHTASDCHVPKRSCATKLR